MAVSVVIAAATACLGLVLARGRWARWLAAGVLVGQFALAVIMGLDVWTGIALSVTVVTGGFVAGPWLDAFLRQLPPADPLPGAAVALAIVLLFVPAALATAAPGGVGLLHWVAGLGALITGWAFARALVVGLWSARVLIPLLIVGAAFDSPTAGTVGAVAVAGVVAALAWMPGTARAVSPLVSAATGVAVPPELVPADLLARAGYDDRGRPVRRPPT